MYGKTKLTTDHRVIRKWIEERGGVPAGVDDDRAVREEEGVIRIYFPEQQSMDELKPMTWETFFQKFDQAHLAFMYEDGAQESEKGRFFKFISRNGE